jgi:hypothetical protein
LLNIVFETDFQDRANLHGDCVGGISIQYNVYRNEEYYVNLIDVSRNVDEDYIIELAKACNMIIIHTKK